MSIFRKYVMKYLWHRFKLAYRAGNAVLDYSPREVWIEPTNRCNLKCVMCPQSRGIKAPKGYMDMGLFLKIIDDLKKLRVQRINLFMGGESLLHKEFAVMSDMAARRGMKVRLHTNATIMTEAISERLLASGNLDEISFSFDGEDAAYYERLRVNADFEKTLSNIRKFLEIKKSLGCSHPRVIVQVVKECPADGRPPEISEGFRQRFEGLPVDEFKPVSFHNFGGTLNPGEDVKYEMVKKDYKPCRHPWKSFNIAWDGDVVGCCVDIDKKLVLGNVRDQSIMEVWNGKPYQEFRRALYDGRFKEVELCADCDHLFR